MGDFCYGGVGGGGGGGGEGGYVGAEVGFGEAAVAGGAEATFGEGEDSDYFRD